MNRSFTACHIFGAPPLWVHRQPGFPAFSTPSAPPAAARKRHWRTRVRGHIRQDEFGTAWIHLCAGRATFDNYYGSLAEAAEAAFHLGMVPENDRRLLTALSGSRDGWQYELTLPRGYDVCCLRDSGFDVEFASGEDHSARPREARSARNAAAARETYPYGIGPVRAAAYAFRLKVGDLLKLRLKPLNL